MDFKNIEKKWQKIWADKKIFQVKEDPKKKKFYVLEMYPYPSGSGLHMGHARNYCIGDSFARFKRMRGFNVLYPMGYDSFGLPAENAAIEAKSHPKVFTEKAVENFIKQQKSLGLSYDWTRMIMSHDPEFYKWDQWIFLKMFEKRLVYKKKSAVNWCPKCNTVLANEQVHNGKCWRHADTDVEAKELNQWYFKITEYAEELLQDIDKLDWSEDVKTMQRNWIGKSTGIEIFFKLADSKKVLSTYTTRCDTIYSVTFIVMAPEHPLAREFVKGTEYEEEFNRVTEIIKKQSIIERTTPEGKDKLGCFLGKYAINPANNEKIPVYIANFALMDYGTGIVMADAHDQRDFEFARKYKIPLKMVISKDGKPVDAEKAEEAYVEDGILFDSGKFSGMHNREALPLVTDWFEENSWGKKTINYKLRDWLISRQRFWGTPIPVIYCDKCGAVPVPEKDLPVKLPDDIKFTSAENPLLNYKPFLEAKCPKCGGKGKRETDTMDTFLNSSWYFLRYCDPRNKKQIFDPEKTGYWMPIDQYIGGKEHACMHLIYFRFYTKFLRDLGLLKIDEPAVRLFNQGVLYGSDGTAMSKSRGNVVLPEEVADKYGIDTARLFLLMSAGPDKDMEWNEKGVEGAFRFINKFFSLSQEKSVSKIKDKFVISKMHKTIKQVTNDMEELSLNSALRAVMEFVNYISKYKENISRRAFDIDLKNACLMLAPFIPHTCEEVWSRKNKKLISLEKWPSFDGTKINPKYEAEEEVVSVVLKDIEEIKKISGISNPRKISIVVSYPWKYEVYDLVLAGKDLKEIMKEDKYKKLGKELVPYIQRLMKRKPLEELFLSAGSEFKILKDSKGFIEKEFDCKVKILEAEKFKGTKAKSAEPGKPGLLIE